MRCSINHLHVIKKNTLLILIYRNFLSSYIDPTDFPSNFNRSIRGVTRAVPWPCSSRGDLNRLDCGLNHGGIFQFHAGKRGANSISPRVCVHEPCQTRAKARRGGAWRTESRAKTRKLRDGTPNGRSRRYGFCVCVCVCSDWRTELAMTHD